MLKTTRSANILTLILIETKVNKVVNDLEHILPKFKKNKLN